MSAETAEKRASFAYSPEQEEVRRNAGEAVSIWLSTLCSSNFGEIHTFGGSDINLSEVADVVWDGLVDGKIFFVVDENVARSEIGLKMPIPIHDASDLYRELILEIADGVIERNPELASDRQKMEQVKFMGEMISLQVPPDVTPYDCMKSEAKKGLVKLFIEHRRRPSGLYDLSHVNFNNLEEKQRLTVCRITANDPITFHDPRFGPFPKGILDKEW